MIGRVWLGACALLLGAAGPVSDPDWPCVQRLVPVITASSLWSGGTGGDWRRDADVAALVAAVAPRSRPVDASLDRLKAFVATVPQADRPARLALVFTGLLEQTNEQRTQVIDRLRAVARRQQAMVDATSRITTELRALPATAAASDREEITSRRALMIREYEEIERTILYSCEVPVQLETRLGQFVQVLQAGLPS